MYDPTIGKFISEDPLGFDAGDVNLCRYVGNQVTITIDPQGLWGQDIHYYLLYFTLKAKGYQDLEAWKIAYYSQYIDDHPVTQPAPIMDFTSSKAPFRWLNVDPRDYREGTRGLYPFVSFDYAMLTRIHFYGPFGGVCEKGFAPAREDVEQMFKEYNESKG